MKIALFTGTAYRHIYFANAVGATNDVVLHVREKRSNELIDEIRVPYSDADKKLLQIHSDERLKKEKEYFLPQGETFLEAKRVIEVGRGVMNTPEVIAAVKETNPDVVLVYGTGLIRDELLGVMPKYVINLHAGLSPNYKGAATLYWPIYFMEPQNVGFTFHIIDLKIDHGDILHQNKPEILPNDGIHDLGCRTIVVASRDIQEVLKRIASGNVRSEKQVPKGKLFYTTDFKPYHLRVTNFLMNNGLLKEYLEHKELFPAMKIFSQFSG